MSTSRLLLLCARWGPTPAFIAKALEGLDTEVFAVCVRPNNTRSGEEFARDVQRLAVKSVEVPRLPDVRDAALSLGREANVQGVTAFSELVIEDAATVGAQLGLPSSPAHAVHLTRNKALQRSTLARTGIPAPHFAVVANRNDLERAVRRVGLPAVLKPATGGGSFLVQPVTTAQEAREAFDRALATPPFSDGAREFLLEELMTGKRWHEDPRYADYVSVESILHRGQVHPLCVQDRTPPAWPFRETGLIAPSALDSSQQAELFHLNERAIRAIGLSEGTAHVEIKFTPVGPKIIEVNGRPGGTFVFRLPEASNMNLVREVIRSSLGSLPQTRPEFHSYTGAFHPAPPPHDARVMGISGEQEARSLPGVTNVRITKKPGDTILVRLGALDAIGTISVLGETSEAVLKLFEALPKILRVQTEPMLRSYAAIASPHC